jgi:predicted transcriptional regulator
MSQSVSGNKDEKRRQFRFVYDSFMFRFVATHADWICRKLSLNVQLGNDRSGQLFGTDGVRRFVDAIFDAILDFSVEALMHVEVQATYSSNILRRMAEYHMKILDKFGWRRHVIQAVLFLRRPPQRLLDRCVGTPSVLGYLSLDMTAVSVEEYLRLGSGPAVAAAALSRVGDAQQNARLIVERVISIKDAEERRHCLTGCLHFAKLRKDGHQYLEYMDMALESVFERMPKSEAESERKFLARTWKKVGFAQGKRIGIDEGKRIGIDEGKRIGIDEGKRIGIDEGKRIGIDEGKRIGMDEGKRIGIDEGKRIGLVSERKSTVRKLRQKGHTPEGIADLLDLSVNEVMALLED